MSPDAMSEATGNEHLICVCPICRTRFRASDDLLQVAGGQVRCGACLAVFNGHDHLVTQTADEYQAAVPQAAAQQAAAPQAAAPQAPQENPAMPARGGVRAGSSVSVPPAPPPAGSRQQFPAARVGPPARRPLLTLLAVFCILALAAMLAGNLLQLRWDAWSQQPGLRDIYAKACDVIGCQLPPLRAVGDIELMSRAFQTRQGPPEAITLTLELRNRAHFAQPFPTLGLRLFDARGRIAGTHQWQPAEYLEADAPRQMAPRQRISVAVHFDDPGAEATDYSLSLL